MRAKRDKQINYMSKKGMKWIVIFLSFIRCVSLYKCVFYFCRIVPEHKNKQEEFFSPLEDKYNRILCVVVIFFRNKFVLALLC